MAVGGICRDDGGVGVGNVCVESVDVFGTYADAWFKTAAVGSVVGPGSVKRAADGGSGGGIWVCVVKSAGVFLAFLTRVIGCRSIAVGGGGGSSVRPT